MSGEVLAEALRAAGVEVGSVGGQAFREHVAARLLASDWMKRHDAEVRAETWDEGYVFGHWQERGYSAEEGDRG